MGDAIAPESPGNEVLQSPAEGSQNVPPKEQIGDSVIELGEAIADEVAAMADDESALAQETIEPAQAVAPPLTASAMIPDDEEGKEPPQPGTTSAFLPAAAESPGDETLQSPAGGSPNVLTREEAAGPLEGMGDAIAPESPGNETLQSPAEGSSNVLTREQAADPLEGMGDAIADPAAAMAKDESALAQETIEAAQPVVIPPLTAPVMIPEEEEPSEAVSSLQAPAALEAPGNEIVQPAPEGSPDTFATEQPVDTRRGLGEAMADGGSAIALAMTEFDVGTIAPPVAPAMVPKEEPSEADAVSSLLPRPSVEPPEDEIVQPAPEGFPDTVATEQTVDLLQATGEVIADQAAAMADSFVIPPLTAAARITDEEEEEEEELFGAGSTSACLPPPSVEPPGDEIVQPAPEGSPDTVATEQTVDLLQATSEVIADQVAAIADAFVIPSLTTPAMISDGENQACAPEQIIDSALPEDPMNSQALPVNEEGQSEHLQPSSAAESVGITPCAVAVDESPNVPVTGSEETPPRDENAEPPVDPDALDERASLPESTTDPVIAPAVDPAAREEAPVSGDGHRTVDIDDAESSTPLRADILQTAVLPLVEGFHPTALSDEAIPPEKSEEQTAQLAEGSPQGATDGSVPCPSGDHIPPVLIDSVPIAAQSFVSRLDGYCAEWLANSDSSEQGIWSAHSIPQSPHADQLSSEICQSFCDLDMLSSSEIEPPTREDEPSAVIPDGPISDITIDPTKLHTQLFDASGIPLTDSIVVSQNGSPQHQRIYDWRRQEIPSLKAIMGNLADQSSSATETEQTDNEWDRALFRSAIEAQLSHTDLTVAISDSQIALDDLNAEIAELEDDRDSIPEISIALPVFSFAADSLSLIPPPVPHFTPPQSDVGTDPRELGTFPLELARRIHAFPESVPHPELSPLQAMIVTGQLSDLQAVQAQTAGDNSTDSKEIKALENRLRMVSPSGISQKAMSQAKYQTAQLTKHHRLEELDSDIEKNEAMILELDQAIADAQFVLEQLKREIADRQRQANVSVIALVGDFGEVRHVDMAWHEKARLIAIESDFYDRQLRKFEAMIGSENVEPIRMAVQRLHGELEERKALFRRGLLEAPKIVGYTLTTPWELTRMDEQIGEAKTRIANLERRESLARSKVGKLVRQLRDAGGRLAGGEPRLL
jgi:hypothetical protein